MKSPTTWFTRLGLHVACHWGSREPLAHCLVGWRMMLVASMPSFAWGVKAWGCFKTLMTLLCWRCFSPTWPLRFASKPRDREKWSCSPCLGRSWVWHNNAAEALCIGSSFGSGDQACERQAVMFSFVKMWRFCLQPSRTQSWCCRTNTWSTWDRCQLRHGHWKESRASRSNTTWRFASSFCPGHQLRALPDLLGF